MALIAKQDSESNFPPLPEGVHVAICYAVIDLGLQYSEKYNKSYCKIRIIWELPSETFEQDGEMKPRAISKEYTLSLGEKSNLRKDLQAWRGRAFTEEELEGFDMQDLLGKGCQIQIIHKKGETKTYANIAGIMGLPKGMKVDKPYNPLMYFDLSESDYDDKFKMLPQWIQDKIKASETWKGMQADEASVDDTSEFDGGNIEEDDGGLPF